MPYGAVLYANSRATCCKAAWALELPARASCKLTDNAVCFSWALIVSGFCPVVVLEDLQSDPSTYTCRSHGLKSGDSPGVSDLNCWEAFHSELLSEFLVRFLGGVHLGQGDSLLLQRP